MIFLQRMLAGLLFVAGTLMCVEASTSAGHAVICEPETFQPAYCKPPKLFLTNSGLGCHHPNGSCNPPDDSTVCADQAYWGTVEPARCVFAVTNSTSGICLMGYTTVDVKIHYMTTVCKHSEGFCSCKGVAIKEIFLGEQEVCACGDLVVP